MNMANKLLNTTSKTLFFQDILGQARALNYLRTARLKGRLAHAYLFLGPEGVGKATTARALAGALNCQALTEDGDACGQCPACARLAAGTDPDFLEIFPTSEGRQPQIKIDQIRELRRLTAYPPLGGGWRVALIRPAEALNDAAANALLKTLEEPPAQHLLILTAGVEADLFPTVVSRCQKVAFAPLPTGLIREELARRGRAPSEAALLASLSGGSLGRALALDPADLARQRGQVLDDLARLPQGSLSAILDWAQRLTKNAAEADTFLRLAALWYRDLLLLREGAPAALLAHQDALPALEPACRQGSPKAWFAGLAAIAAAQRQLRGNLNPELTMDVLGLNLKKAQLP
jgi:DNA polymerase-3 subunit delta'